MTEPNKTEAPGLLKAEIDGFKVQWKNDGFDYPAFWRSFREDQSPGEILGANPLYRSAWKVEFEGRLFLIKKDWYTERRLEKRLFYRLVGQKRYGRIISLINRAVNKGCRCVQEAFLTAETTRPDGRDEAWLIAAFIPGRPSLRSELEENLGEFTAVIKAIHDYGLACNDIQPNNFIRPETAPQSGDVPPQTGGLMAVDLDMSSPLIICQVNDILKMKRRYGVKIPMTGRPGLRFICGLLEIRDNIMRFSRRLRGKPDKLKKRV